MNNIPENQEPLKEENAEEFSTVFSDPTEHRKTADKVGKKRNWPKAVAAILAAAVLITGTVLVIKLIPKREEETSSEGLESISVLEMDSDDFKTVTVTNANGTFKFYSADESEEDASYKTINWYLDGYEKELISTSNANNAPDEVANITASRKITEKTAAECGLESPAIRVDVVTNDDAEFSVFVGTESPDKSGHYLKLSTSEDIYLVESTVAENLTFDEIFFANNDAIPAIPATDDLADYGTDGTLSKFDSIVVSGKDYAEPVVIKPNTDELTSQYMPYMVTSPTKRIADNMDELFQIFSSGLTVEGAYSFDVTAESLKEFGLDDPDFVAGIVLGEKVFTYMFALQEDGSYAVACDLSPLIKKVSADSLPFVNYKATDFYSSWVAFNAIMDVKTLTVKTPEKDYVFGITSETDENDSTTYTITYEGETLVTEDFQDFYQQCISLACSEYTVEEISSDPEYTIIFEFNDDIGGKNVIEFRKASATKYQYRTDGVDIGKVTSSSLNKIIKAMKELVE